MAKKIPRGTFVPKLLADSPYPAVGVDFETFYNDEISIKTMGADKYLRHAQCDVYLVTVYDGENTFTGRPEDFDWRSIDGRLLVSWNAGFDKLVHDILAEKKIIDACRYGEWNCAANLSVYLRARRDLKHGVFDLYGIKPSKDYRKFAKGKTEQEMRQSPQEWQDLVDSNVADTQWAQRVWTDNVHKWPLVERRASIMTYEQCHRGFPVDTKLVMTGIKKMAAVKQQCADGVPWECTAEQGVVSIDAFKAACKAEQIPVPASTSEDTVACRNWERDYGERFPWISNMRNWRKCNIMTKRLEVVRDRMNAKTGRFSYALKYGGAHTLRWTGGSRGGTEETGFSTQTFSKEPVFGIDQRAIVIPSKGRKLIISDAAQIEPRCLAWLSGDVPKLDRIRQGISVYQVHAEDTMAWPKGEDMKSKDKKQYQLAKIRVLGLGYGCGHIKFQVFAEVQYNYLMTLAESKVQVKDFRAKEKFIMRLWNKLHAEFEDSIKNPEFVDMPDGRRLPCHVIVLPSGREMQYFNPRHERRANVFKKAKSRTVELVPAKPLSSPKGPDRDELSKASDYRMEMCANKEVNGRVAFFYGGLLTENVTQSCARDVFNEMMIRVEDAFGSYAPILFHSHDELILDADPGISPREVEEVMAVSPDWMDDCPFGAEAIEADHYVK